MKKKLIEVALPLEAINKESAREKSIRHGHPSTLHLRWARRLLAACRAVLFASLVDDPSSLPERFPTEADQDKERQRGRIAGAITVTVTRNEILTALNKPDDFILAIGQVDDGQRKLFYIRRPFQQEPDFAVESINYNLQDLLSRGESPA